MDKKKLEEYRKQLAKPVSKKTGNELVKKEDSGSGIKMALVALFKANEKISITNSFKQLQESLRGVRTVKEALAVKTPSFAKLRKELGEKKAAAYIKLWLIDLNASLNLTKALTEYQIEETARLVLGEFWGLTIADVNIVFKNAKLGVYGNLYGALSMDKIFNWFRSYLEERLEVAAEIAQEKHDSFKYLEEKSERLSSPNSEQIAEANKLIIEQMQRDYKNKKNDESKR